MSRKFISVVPITEPERSGIWLYAVADDGSAWTTRHYANGEIDSDGWIQLSPLPDNNSQF